MMLWVGFSLLSILPIVESLNNQYGLLLLLVGSIFVFLKSFLQKEIHLDLIDNLFLVLLIIFFISFQTSWSYKESFMETMRYLAFFMIFIAIRHSLENRRMITFYVYLILINSIILSILLLINNYLMNYKLKYVLDDINLIYAKTRHNHIADILIFAIPITLFIKTDKKIYKLLLNFLRLFLITVLIFSYSRGALLSLSLAFGIYFFLSKSKSYFLHKWIGLIFILTILFLTSSFVISNIISVPKQYRSFIKVINRPVKEEMRFEYISQAYKGFLTNPLFGTGVGTFRYVSQLYQNKSDSWSGYAHNHYLEIFTESGVFGGIVFLLLISLCLHKSYQNILSSENEGIFIALLSSSIHSLLDADWHFNSIFLLYWLGLALLVRLNK